MKDDLGERMKSNYEFVTRMFLPRRTYTIIRLDGKAFHSYTKKLERPYDSGLMDDMAATTVHLCKEIAGTAFGYTQSDEISLVLTDFATPQTQAWFGGNIQKIVSVAASICTQYFSQRRDLRGRQLLHEGVGIPYGPAALFDARVFTVPDPTEVANYFVWRQKDATRNSISMAAQSVFSHNDLMNKSSNDLQEMLWKYKNINWNDYPVAFKRGQLVAKQETDETISYTNSDGEEINVEGKYNRWARLETPVFTQSDWLKEHIPTYN